MKELAAQKQAAATWHNFAVLGGYIRVMLGLYWGYIRVQGLQLKSTGVGVGFRI